ncbi:protein FAM110C isoform X2 [Perognathus longimembris pacificus]|uniref:protein FAM110C isoform X2 n=1 Tax=Perognathus longimembris pacificus TaxID=214514 RepID=UPI0020198EB0|nr:protein FAM110C isoform X2 [Perognathus longimembris pacificus]
MRAPPALGEQRSPRPSPRDAEGTLYSQPARPACRSAVERLAADRAKYAHSPPGSGGAPSSAGRSPGAVRGQLGLEAPAALAPEPVAPAPVARRAVARKPLRPDSLVIYRQKCEIARGGAGADRSRGSLVKKLFHGPGKEKAPGPLETCRVEAGEASRPKPCSVAAAAPESPGSPLAPAASLSPPAQAGTSAVPAATLPVLERRVAKRRDLQRSRSDLGSRFSTARQEVDTFFKYCGLDPEVVEALGRENFSAQSDHTALKL